MDLSAKLKDAMKAKDDLARDLLRVVMGEVSTRESRTGKAPGDEEIHGIIRKVIAGNVETRDILAKRGQTETDAYAKLGREIVYLETLLPKSLDRDAITKELQPIVADLKAAKNDGQATGLAMKHLKQKGLTVAGDDVSAAVKAIRVG